MKVRDVIKQLQDDGWVLQETKGSHRQFEHPDKTVPGHPGDDVPVGTLNSILKQAGLK